MKIKIEYNIDINMTEKEFNEFKEGLSAYDLSMLMFPLKLYSKRDVKIDSIFVMSLIKDHETEESISDNH